MDHNFGHFDVIIIGAGASGLYCALTAGRRGRRVLVLDHANKAGKKILMSGGGRCNFTNYFVEPEHFISDNAHFCKSALSRYPSWEFIGMVEAHGIAYHEREHGQLFCDDSAKDIVTMLLAECQAAGVTVCLNTHIDRVTINQAAPDHHDITQRFTLITQHTPNKKDKIKKDTSTTSTNTYHCASLVIATGGLSIPTMGASGFGYEIAKQFGHTINTTEASLVPFTFTDKTGDFIKNLAGISIPVVASNARISFRLPMLFTHRGLSGPAMLQLSNYWHSGEVIHINLMPHVDVAAELIARKKSHPKQLIRTLISDCAHQKNNDKTNNHTHDNPFPKKLLAALEQHFWADIKDTELANIKDERLITIGAQINDWQLKPSGTEGYRTAEVTRGGVDTNEVSSKTMQSKKQEGLYFIGEVLDVTGWLGGYNFQWAWASGFVCGEVV